MDWLQWTFAAAFLAVAGYCVARLVAAARAPVEYQGCHRAVDIAHVLMGVGMAAMVSPVGGPLPMAAWQTVFLLMTAWFVGAWWRSRGTTAWHGGWHSGGLHHALAAVAMFYMLTAMPHSGHRSAPWLDEMGTGLAFPLVGWVLAVYFVGTAVVLVARWRVPALAGPAGLPSVLSGSRVTATCEVTMALGAGYMMVATLS